MRRLKVHVLFEHAADLKPYGSSYIRLLLPLDHPNNRDALEVTRGLEYRRADVLIVDRLWRPDISMDMARRLIRRARRDGVKIAYSIDDNLLDLEPYPPLRFWPSDEHKLVASYLARRSDAVIVSTDTLRQRFSSLNEQTIALPNAIDERLFFPSLRRPSKPGRNQRLTIGYMGTLSHDEDLLMIVEPLRDLLSRTFLDGRSSTGTELSFEIVGGLLDKSLLGLFEELPVRLLSVPDSDVEYPRFVPWMKKNLDWDLAIAPLVEDSFTRCKSDIKFLDYAGLGVPGIYSKVTAYRDTVVHLQTGFLAENHSQGWANAFSEMIEDGYLRERIATASNSHVAKERTLDICATRWRDALLNL